MDKSKYADFCNQPDLPKRHRQFCDGTSGLTPEKEIFYLEKLTGVPITEPPGIIERGLSFVGAIADYAFAGFPAMPEGESERRLSICRACPEFVPESSQCRQCGCYMNLKTQLATSVCPLGLWGVATQKGPPSEDSDPK